MPKSMNNFSLIMQVGIIGKYVVGFLSQQYLIKSGLYFINQATINIIKLAPQ